MKIKSKLFAAFSTIVGVTVILGIMTVVSVDQINSQFKFLVEHDLNVLQNAQKLQKLVVDAETGQRGFVITGDESFLDPYYSGVSGFDELIETEKELVSDNPPQVERLELIQELFEEWIEKAAIPEIEMARAVHQSTVSSRTLEAILSEGTGKGILDEIRVNLDVLERNLDLAGNLEAELVVLSIAKDVVDRETGQRGFLITGNDEFLEPYEKGAEKFEIDIAKLKTILSDDPENLQIVNRIEFLENEWIEKAAVPEINARIKVNESPDITNVADLLLAGTGKSILDQIRVEFDEFTKIENDLKDKRFETVSTIESYTHNGVLAFTIFAIAVGIVVSIYLLRSINTPITRLKDGFEKMGKGEYVQLKVSGKDELTDLTRSFNSTITNLLQSKIIIEENIDSEKRQNRIDAEFKELKKSDILKEEFSSMVTHELKTPLTPIRGYCEMLQDESFGTLTKDQLDYVKKIDSSAASLQRLIGDLLDVQKLDMKRMQFNIQSLDVDKFLDKLEQDSAYLMKNKGIEFVIANSLKFSIETDELRLRQILDNMIRNSVDFVPSKDGRIEVGAKQENGKMIFYVKDNGDGIPKEKQKNIFKKFYQVDTSHTRSHGGTGLGLVICKGLVEGLGGKIWFESEPGKRTTFFFTIPIYKEKTTMKPSQ